MSLDSRSCRYCDGCGRSMITAERVVPSATATREFCRACYKRLFRRMLCPTCNHTSRVLREDPNPTCPRCERAHRRCIRCDHPVARAGLLHQGKPVCPSCARFYRPEVACGRCGTMTTRWYPAVTPSGAIRICQPCHHQDTHATCVRCRRYRAIASTRDEGPCCIACSLPEPATHACPGCGEVVPGDGLGHCRSCLVRQRVSAHASVAAAAYEHDWCRELCQCFARTLIEERSSDLHLERRFAGQLPLFERIDTSFASTAEITGTSLLSHFRVDELRRHLLGTRFITKQLGLTIPEDARVQQVESGRIVGILMRCRRDSWSGFIAGFDAWMARRSVAWRTRRLYLATAERFARSRRLGPDRPMRAEDLLGYLRRRRGARANLSSFVTYANTELGWSVRMPPRALVGKPPARMPRTVARIARVLDEIEGKGLEATSTRALQRLIATALGFTVGHLKESRWRLEEGRGSTRLQHDDEDIALPKELIAPVREWLRRRSAEPRHR